MAAESSVPQDHAHVGMTAEQRQIELGLKRDRFGRTKRVKRRIRIGDELELVRPKVEGHDAKLPARSHHGLRGRRRPHSHRCFLRQAFEYGLSVMIAANQETVFTPMPIVGYRMWRLGPGTIRGLSGQLWRSAAMDAACTNGPEGSPHLPTAPCRGRCGINAYTTPAQLLAAARSIRGPRRLSASSPHIGIPIPEALYGVVSLSGRVVEHDHGFRGQRARVIGLVMVHGREVQATGHPGTIAAHFPNPAGSRRRFETRLIVDDPDDIPSVVVGLLSPETSDAAR